MSAPLLKSTSTPGSETPPPTKSADPLAPTVPSAPQPDLKGLLDQVRSSQTHTARTANMKKALETHRDTTPNDGRVKLDPVTNLFKGKHFRGDDPMHKEALSTVPEAHKYKMALAQEAMEKNQPLHLTHKAAKSSPAVVTSRESRTQEYKQEEPGKRQEEHQESGHTIMPTAIGVTFGKKADEPNRGYIQGLSSSVAASNAHHLNHALGKDSPYPDITHPKFHQDLAGYIGNLNNGYTGDGHQPAKSTKDVENKPTKGYEPHLLEEHEANFLNATLHNVAAKGKGESARIARELAEAHGRDVGPDGETNPLRKKLDEQKAKRSWYPGMPEEPGKPWSEEMLEPVIRHFNAEHIRTHDRPEDIAEMIRPPEGTQQIQEAFQKHGVPNKDMVAAHVLSGPIGEEKEQPPPKKEPRVREGGGPPGPGEFPTKSKTVAKAVEKPPAEELETGAVTPETERLLGPRPKDKKQAALWDRVGARLDSQIEEGIPLVPNRDEKKKFKTDSKGNPDYKKINYDIANAPMLQKLGKALGRSIDSSGKETVAKAPAGTEDKLEKGDLHYLKPADRLRVSHLNAISAVDTYADELLKEYKGIEHLPEVMAGKDWYSEAEQILRKHFGKDADFVANLLGATSAGTNVKVNYKMAMEAYHNWLEGKYDKHIDLYRKAHEIRNQGKGALAQHVLEQGITPELPKTDAAAMAHYIAHHDIVPKQSNGKLFGHNSLAVLKVLAHTWLDEVEAPKTPNFAGNLSGRTLQATIDMWAARTMRRLGYEGHADEPWMIQPPAETGVTDTDFGLSQLAFRKAAEKIGIAPSSLQAILWFNEQKHYQDRGWERQIDPSERDYRPMLQKYQPRQKAA